MGAGRFLYELLSGNRRIPAATGLEPSEILYSWSTDILDAWGIVLPYVPVVEGGDGIRRYTYGAVPDIERNIAVGIRPVHGQVDKLESGNAGFDLVCSLNVFDQCAELAARIKNRVNSGGAVVFSVAYQFQQRLYIDSTTIFRSLHELFEGDRWRLVGEIELEYESRNGERHRNRFLSHHVMYCREN